MASWVTGLSERLAELRLARGLDPVAVVGAGVGGATHLVQIVEVIVLVTCDTVDPV